MEYIIKGGQLLLSLSILIVLHELGHYLPARWFKTRVEKFYLFFDYKFSLFKKKVGDTVWGIGWIPLGGYVKISGMIDESMDKEQMKKDPEPWEFRSKPAWQRFIIMIGGVTVNLILGMIIYMMVVFVWGRDYLSNDNLPHGMAVHEHFQQFGFKDGDKILKVEGKELFSATDISSEIALFNARNIEVLHEDGTIETIVLPDDIDMTMFYEGALQGFSPRYYSVLNTVVPEGNGEKAGLLVGDSIVALNGTPTVFWNEFMREVPKNKGDEVVIDFYRNNELLSISVVIDTTNLIGIAAGFDEKYYSHKNYSFFESIPFGFTFGWRTLAGYVKQFKYIFTKKGASSVGGFGAIGGMFSPTWNWHSFWLNTALISIILAFMNILPIPALDGGHLMFLSYEIITGRKPNQKIMEYAQIVGMILLLGLLLYANGNDIFKLFK